MHLALLTTIRCLEGTHGLPIKLQEGSIILTYEGSDEDRCIPRLCVSSEDMATAVAWTAMLAVGICSRGYK